MEDWTWSVKNGDIDALRALLGKGLDVNKAELNGRHPIHYAADYGQSDIIDILVAHGADVNLPDKFGITPLLAAIYEDHGDCVRLLLSKGANKAGKAPDGRSYADCAESDEIKKLLQ